MNKLIVIFCVIGFFIQPYLVRASGFDGSSPLLCAVIEAMECSTDNGCQKTTAEVMDIPQFVKINLDQKKITAPGASDDNRITTIKSSEHVGGKLIMQGMSDNGRGWSAVISEDTGKMSAAVIDDQFGFIIFGACTPFQ